MEVVDWRILHVLGRVSLTTRKQMEMASTIFFQNKWLKIQTFALFVDCLGFNIVYRCEVNVGKDSVAVDGARFHSRFA